MRSMTVYQVQDYCEWITPSLVYVKDGMIVGIQANADNDLTYTDVNPEVFKSNDYLWVRVVN